MDRSSTLFTRKTANTETKTFLLGTLARGRTLRLKFDAECVIDVTISEDNGNKKKI